MIRRVYGMIFQNKSECHESGVTGSRNKKMIRIDKNRDKKGITKFKVNKLYSNSI